MITTISFKANYFRLLFRVSLTIGRFSRVWFKSRVFWCLGLFFLDEWKELSDESIILLGIA